MDVWFSLWTRFAGITSNLFASAYRAVRLGVSNRKTHQFWKKVRRIRAQRHTECARVCQLTCWTLCISKNSTQPIATGSVIANWSIVAQQGLQPRIYRKLVVLTTSFNKPHKFINWLISLHSCAFLMRSWWTSGLVSKRWGYCQTQLIIFSYIFLLFY